MKKKLFMDSGAYSAWTQGITIDIDEYIEFIKTYEDCMDYYINLDVIGDGEASYRNWIYMRDKGLEPIPVYHPNTNLDYLREYIEVGGYISIGGITATTKKERILTLDRIWNKYLVDAKGYPIVKVHGLGLGSMDVLVRYPWYSVDSTTWLQQAIYGKIILPKTERSGKLTYAQTPLSFAVSGRSPARSKEGVHINTISEHEREKVLEYIYSKGYELGVSDFRKVSADYELEENEDWVNFEVDGKREVETVVESGLSNNYKQRLKFNIEYFLELEETSLWPRKYTGRKILGIGDISVEKEKLDIEPLSEVMNIYYVLGSRQLWEVFKICNAYKVLTSYWAVRNSAWLKNFVIGESDED